MEVLIEGLKEGVIDCILIDYVLYYKDEKNVEFNFVVSGIIGFEIVFFVLFIYFVEKNGFELGKVVEFLN